MPAHKARGDPRALKVHRLDLVDFRNYPALTMLPPPGASVLIGPNGAGKTNIIEAVHLVLTGFSHRAGRDAEMLLHGRPAFAVRAQVERDELPGDLLEYQVQYVAHRKTVKRGNQVLTGRSRTAAMGAAVVFAPDDLEIVKGAPAARRGFLDGTASKAAPAYRTAARRYETALAHRNRLLGEWSGTPAEETQLNVWTEQLVACGSAVLAYRLRCLRRLAPLIVRYYGAMAGGSEPLGMAYGQAHGPTYSIPLDGQDAAPPDPAELASTIMAALAATRQQERARGVTLAGPHRDDLVLTINNQDSRVFASQGQQRSIALALRLAESSFLQSVSQERPVLLLDDVFSELDERRRDALLSLLGLAHTGQQTFITATDLAGIPATGLGAVATFAVGQGQVTRNA